VRVVRVSRVRSSMFGEVDVGLVVCVSVCGCVWSGAS
jgi:hypothetical protein